VELVELVCLGDANVLLNVSGKAYFINLADPHSTPALIPVEQKVTAIARAYGPNRSFGLATAAGDAPNRPQLTRWDYSTLV
jgi:hypothetical protein